MLWANLHLLFWLSLIPFTTRWINDAGLAQVPVLVYGLNLLLAAIAYYILKRPSSANRDVAVHSKRPWGRTGRARDRPALYIAGMGLSLVNPLLGIAAYIGGRRDLAHPRPACGAVHRAHLSPRRMCPKAITAGRAGPATPAGTPDEPGWVPPRAPRSPGACRGTS